MVGAGHAGIEAAVAAARLGQRTLLITMNIDSIGQMSCNPAIGGIGKGHLVKEIDALGGVMGELADLTAIQYRTLNTKKGSAVQATRCQSDMNLYKIEARKLLQNTANLDIKQAEVVDFIMDGLSCVGLVTNLEQKIFAKKVIITTGTFLNGLIHIGQSKTIAGRAGEFAALSLTAQLNKLGIRSGRLKTGTTPRLEKSSIDFSELEAQPGQSPAPKFSFWGKTSQLPQIECHITYSNEQGHQILRDNLKKSAIYSGDITSTGPRYCPSIEDKVVKFSDKTRHQIFLEPISLSSTEYYPNGLSTSMPLSVQIDFLRTIKGLENVEVIRPGYAIEYDYFYPDQLRYSLELKSLKNIYLAGQINGTTGYEEAAAQGLMAGINAALAIKGQDEFILRRDEAYIGVLIDDLITKSTEEPYRMFTSRAEYRLMLREDNADQRLSLKARDTGLLSAAKFQIFQAKIERLDQLRSIISQTREFELGGERLNLLQYINRPDFEIELIAEQIKHLVDSFSFTLDDLSTVLAEVKYDGYIKRQSLAIEKYKKQAAMSIPDHINYSIIPGLSLEVQEKLIKFKPETLAQALKISGITPAAITIISVFLKSKKISLEHGRSDS